MNRLFKKDTLITLLSLLAVATFLVYCAPAQSQELTIGKRQLMQVTACETQAKAEAVAKVDQDNDGNGQLVNAALSENGCGTGVVMGVLRRLLSTWECATDGTTYVLEIEISVDGKKVLIYALTTQKPAGLLDA
jgi:hypothetical protein